MQKKASKLLKQCDLFGMEVSMNYKKHKKYRSMLGGFCSIIVSALTIALVVDQLFDTFLYLSPQTIQYTKNQNDPYEQLIQSGYLQDISLNTQFSITIGDKEYNSIKHNNQYIIPEVENSLSQSIVITGQCERDIKIYVPLVEQDIYDLDTPLNIIGKQEFKGIMRSNKQLIVYVKLRKIMVNTDYGLLFTQMTYNSAYIVDYIDQYYIDMDSINNFVINITVNPIAEIQKREYKRLYRVLSLVGGLIKVLMLIARLVTKPIVKLQFQISFLNKFFNFQDSCKIKRTFYPLNSQAISHKIIQDHINTEQKKELESAKSKNSIQKHHFLKQPTQLIQRILEKYSNSNNEVNDNNDEQQQGEQLQEIQLLQQYFQPYESKLKLQPIQYVIYFFGFTKHIKTKIKQLKVSLNIVNEKMDVVYLIKKLQEVEKLKNILLDENQRQLFGYLPKPTIQGNNKDAQFSHTESSPLFNKAVDAYNSYQLLSNKQDPTHIDIQLLQLIDSNIKKYFNKKLSLAQQSDREQLNTFKSLKFKDDMQQFVQVGLSPQSSQPFKIEHQREQSERSEDMRESEIKEKQ